MWSRRTTSSVPPSTATTCSPCGMPSRAISPPRARADGPFLLECLTVRLGGHYEGDAAKYREADRGCGMAGPGSDPPPAAPRSRGGVVRRGELTTIEAEALAAVDQAVQFGRESPFPPVDLIDEMVYARG